MLADEVTHVKMGSDWLRRLTDKDPERRERALEFQRTVDTIFNLGGFRGEDDENPIQLARRFRELAGFTDEENDSLADARPRVDGAGTRDGGDGDGRARRAAQARRFVTSRHRHARSVHARSRTTRPMIAAIVEDAAALVGFPPDVEIDLDGRRGAASRRSTGHMSDVVDGRARALDLGRQLRGHPAQPRTFSAEQARARPRVRCCCAPRTGSPTTSPTRRPTRELSRGERTAWDVYAHRPGRAARARRPAPARAATTSGSSTASPTSPTPRSTGCWDAPSA